MDKEFPEVLRDYVLEEKQKNPSVNETAIAKQMAIPPTTFNRLVNGHSKPAVSTLLKLSQFIPELKTLLPEEMMKIFKVTLEKEDLEYVGETLEALLSDKNIFLCWLLAFSDKGITVDEIRNHFGYMGVRAIKILEGKKIIENEGGHYKVKEKNKYVIFSFRLIKAHFLFLAEQYNSDNIKSNYICYEMGFVNKEGKKELIQAHRNFHKKIQKIINDEKNKGDEPAFSISCSDSLLGSDIEERSVT